ncbi:hypothetical protein VTK56DRAFT_8204 [Thermocarpiscus australiensis]
MASNPAPNAAPEAVSQPYTLSTSISSLASSVSSGRNSSSSHITKTYRQASTLFLTRRLPEALSTVLPLVSPVPSDDPHGTFEPAPVARASRSSRIKVWSLYLTILNAILELGPDEGKEAFGTQEWRALCHKVRDGDVWEEVVRNGYHGVEGDVDADVVINLATLLLAHAKTQLLNQKRLENYLAAARTPNLDISSDRFSSCSTSPRRRHHSPAKSHRGSVSGADTPRDLHARVKILELYTLHVLPRNGEWETARAFITVSPLLDDERREAFLQALQSLREEQRAAEEAEEERRRRREDAIRRDVEEARRLRAEKEERERRRQKVEEEEEEARAARRRSEAEVKARAAEVDYGVEGSPTPGAPVSRAGVGQSPSSRSKPPGSQPGVGSVPRPRKPLPSASGNAVTLMTRASMILGNLRGLVDEVAVAFQANPYMLYRILAFIVGLLLMLSRRNIRQRIVQILQVIWAKLKATAGMGTKVSYI